MKNVLAFDLGASSGRAILGSYDGEKLTMTEIFSFANGPLSENGTLYWNFDFIITQIEKAIKKAAEIGFDSIAVDTWGVDFGLIDKAGKVLGNPVHYRDARTKRAFTDLHRRIPPDELYSRSGIQLQRFNTLYQLFYLAKKKPVLLAGADKLLLMPDLIVHHLTGRVGAEYTIATTTQLLTPEGSWDTELAGKLGIPTGILPEIIQPGQVYGTLKKELAEKLGCKEVPVIATASHDTAAAVAAIPNEQPGSFYISSGTWSLMGTECAAPVINEKTFEYNLTNEGGFGGTIRLLKNIMGLWILQESRRQWRREGRVYTFPQLEEMAAQNAGFDSVIDPDAPELLPPGDIPARIKELCAKSGQNVPQTDGEVVRCIYVSLASKYGKTLTELESVTGVRAERLHIIGGGSKDDTLSKLTARTCSIPVVAGPEEATAAGNIAVQLITLGELPDLAAARRMIAASFPLKKFTP